MLCRMALKNIRKSFRDYAIYFFTLVIGVSVFYVFNAIETQTSFLVISHDEREMAEILGTVLSSLSVFVAVVLGLLIVFASRFLMPDSAASPLSFIAKSAEAMRSDSFAKPDCRA